jgi:hypothetical protein
MKAKERTFTILVLIVTMVVSSCGPGQLFGSTPTITPTITPTPTTTPTPTITPTVTPTPRPDPIAVLKANGFNQDNSTTFCKKNPCIYYTKSHPDTNVIIWNDGKFEIHLWNLVELDSAGVQTQLDLLQNIITPLYTPDIVSFVMDTTRTLLALPIGGDVSTVSGSGYTIDVNWDRSNASLLRVTITP